MLKAIVTSFGPGAVGVTFESQSYGRTNRELPTFYLPCASREHAMAVAKAYNGVAFTETRETPERKVAKEVARVIDSVPLGPVTLSASMAQHKPRTGGIDDWRASKGRELNHHDDVVASERYRGAPMGIADFTAPDVTPQDALHFGIARIALDKGGYAPDGVYWGLPQGTLWHALATEHGATMVGRWFRAPSYAHAVTHVREEFPNATTQRVPAVMSVTSERVR